MKIERTPEIEAFFKRCMNHLRNDEINGFLGMHVTPRTEKKLQKKMKQAGIPEFSGEEETWPSLFISTQEYLQSPYNTHIRLDAIQSSEFKFTRETLSANELFNVCAIHPDPMRELNDWMTLRALDQPYDAVFLWQGDEVWMMDSPAEANTNDPYAKKAKGKVVTFGLGIGYFIYMAMLNPNVTSITVIEKSKAVIELFQTFIQPQFPTSIPLTIVEGDASVYFNKSFLDDFDFVYVDIWKSNDDGLIMVEKLLERYLPPLDKVDFWIESSIFEAMHALVFMYFHDLFQGKTTQPDDRVYRRIRKKITRHFDSIDITVKDVDTLKDAMYDPQTLRTILSIQI
ncbi:MAG: hypothetical protein A2Y20_06755 [Firmicutes bacterium GWF2_51_9]|nr:hypothetical protein [Erysipelotrichaceae bacterium]OGS54413.1 MAG: hypothetical protein A2Y20_06755 [Firmicutes bacterium GWF2_51_9]OGS58929.1 MAG: hypothetical protein A2Y19_07055 [Firmicutes bacterium GWE2_51_13]HAM63227.1 hypothetical protein [Erysipelotrichaceae bacterium]HAO61673.1 hypothetical protein [Erysipelotrichaceae bacterium]